ncbi:Hypothetical protein I595_205 [Croceitalea dokdonensis DOKDO 023]|uniref:Uncharacterized protein n=1 Tax=Croceitalea dokdonensis DOKDO 023 TaxID=1300341 RepID=A0A0P7B3W3_9FLAO|nr:Hypothetical protein I595_205 [Croceitalea dokdonensis DOKDO 023]
MVDVDATLNPALNPSVFLKILSIQAKITDVKSNVFKPNQNFSSINRLLTPKN